MGRQERGLEGREAESGGSGTEKRGNSREGGGRGRKEMANGERKRKEGDAGIAGWWKEVGEKEKMEK